MRRVKKERKETNKANVLKDGEKNSSIQRHHHHYYQHKKNTQTKLLLHTYYHPTIHKMSFI